MLSTSQRNIIAERLRAGETGRKLAKEFGISETAVSYIRANADLPKGWVNVSRMDRDKVERFKAVYDSGMPYKQMVRELQMSTNAITYWRDKLGLPNRHAERGERPGVPSHIRLPQPIYARLTREAARHTLSLGDLIRAKLAVPYRVD